MAVPSPTHFMQPPSQHELSGQTGAGPARPASFSPARSPSGGLNKKSKRSHGSSVPEDVNGLGDTQQGAPTSAANLLLRSSAFSKPLSSSVGSQQHPSQTRDQQPQPQQQQQQHGQQFQQQHTRATSHGGKNRSVPANGHSEGLGSERAQFSGMGDGILNQSMREDLESKSSSFFHC